MAACEEIASAKINLTLRVGPPGQDGFHPVQSLVVFADWEDQLHISGHERIVLGVSGPQKNNLDGAAQNLALKAAYALRAVADVGELGAKVHLRKVLPVASGVGGGSADAAATLRALNRYWDMNLSTAQLAQIGSVVGSDVPACVYSKPLWMTGRGEKVQPLMAWPRMIGVLVNPGIPVSTRDVFRHYDESRPQPLTHIKIPHAGDYETAVGLIRDGQNDLQETAIKLHPEIGDVLRAIEATKNCAVARMSGSGATCFGIYPDTMAMDAAVEALKAANPDWTVQPVQLSGAIS